jgi:hypothetical protein
MAKSEVRKLVDTLAKGKVVFNDKLENGGRSIKVWGWRSNDYAALQELLQSNGYTVKQVLTPVKNVGKWYENGGSIRLHVI